MDDREKLLRMVDDLRRIREKCEPKNNSNPRYHRLSLAVSSIKWVLDDLAAEEE